jgi:GT2 family glycosyltransferase
VDPHAFILSVHADPAVTFATVAVPTFGREDSLVTTIRSVLSDQSPDFELVVVDQTPNHTPEVEAFLADVDDERLRLYRVSPPSLPAARNYAMEMARGEIIIYIDDDVELGSGFIDAHVRCYDEASVGGVAGRVSGGTEAPETRLFELDLLGRRRGSFDVAGSKPVNWQRGCNMSFRVAALRQLGGFDTRYTGNAYREDSDMSLRLRRAGWRLWYEADARLTHFEDMVGGCKEEGTFSDNPHTLTNHFFFYLKHRLAIGLLAQLAWQTWQVVYQDRHRGGYLARVARSAGTAARRALVEDPGMIRCQPRAPIATQPRPGGSAP